SQKIEQNSEALNIQEGKTATLTCNYTNYSPSYLQWYRQDPGRGPVFLLLIRENEKEKWKERLKVTFDTTLKQSLFHITASQPADSATYLCALDTQWCPGCCFLHPNSAHSYNQSSWLCCLLKADHGS
uniref:Ig-like domain-containing protein n=7 Tax=Cercopithecidae TaxID=9527 RepID=A0A5F8AAN7_MACMU